MGKRHQFGTSTRGGIDQASLRKAASGIGTDLRYWVSHGTVCTLKAEDGELDYADKRAVLCGPEGVEVDVQLEPLGNHVTALYAGIQAGEATIFAPIRPGDRVLVDLPDGDLFTPVIVAILQSRSARQPLDKGKPIFANDRLLVHAKNVPIDIRLAGSPGATPVRVLLEQDGTVTVTGSKIKLGDANASEEYVEGTSYRGAEDTMLDALRTGLAAAAAAAAVGPLAALAPGLNAAVASIVAFQTAATAANGYLSKVIVGK